MAGNYIKTQGPLFYRRRKAGFGKIVVGVAIVILIFLLLPAPISPVAFEPEENTGFEGDFATNTRLKNVQVFTLGAAAGPEDVEPLEDGRAIVGLANGDLVIISPDGTAATIANTGGRPLGLDRDAEGNLIVADAVKGLLKVSRTGEISSLVQAVDGVLLGFTDDVDVAPDGKIYFTDASSHFAIDDLSYDFLAARPYGRLLVHDPDTGDTRVLLDDLYFANGVAVAADGQSLLVNETARYRVRRLWLAGDRAGSNEIILDNLPGFPDGVSRAPDGSFLVALYAPRSGLLDALHPYPWAKALLAKLPQSWLPKPPRHGALLRISGDGKLLESLQNPSGDKAGMITSAEEYGSSIWLGSLEDPYVLRLPLAR